MGSIRSVLSAQRVMPFIRKYLTRYAGQIVTAALVILSYILLNRGMEPLTLSLIVISGVVALICGNWTSRIWYIAVLGVVTCFERHFILHYGDSFRAIGSQALITLHITDADEVRAYLSIFKVVELIQILLFVGGCLVERRFKCAPLLPQSAGACRIASRIGKFAAPVLLVIAAVYQIAPPVADYIETWGAQKEFYLARRNFSFHAVDRDPGSTLFCLLVIGESHRKDEFDRLVLGENGYAPTLRAARKRGELYEFDDMISHYQQTWFSVFTLLCRRGEDARNVLWPEKGLFSLFREAGFRTTYLTYQKRTPENLGYNYVVNEAEIHINHREAGTKFDHGMLPPLASLMESPAPRQFAVIKMSGVHYHYTSRYTEKFRIFTPCYDDKPTEYRPADRELLINSYRNAMAFSATFFDELAKMIDRHPHPAVMVFLSDHGIVNYDDGKNVFFGGAKSNFHIPCFIYGNAAFRRRLPPEQDRALRKNRDLPMTNSYIFDTLVSLARIDYPGRRPQMDLTSDQARPALDRMVWVWDKRMHYDQLP